MAKTAFELLTELEKRRLVPSEIIASLRSQVGKSAHAVSAATVAKLLVDKKLLTAAQAQQILAIASPQAQAAPAAAAKAPAPVVSDLTPLDDLIPLDDLSRLDDLPPLDALDAFGPTAGSAVAAPAAVPLASDPLAKASPRAAPAPTRAIGPTPAQPAKRTGSLGKVLIALLLLAVVGGGAAGAYFLIPRGGGEEALAAAEADYQAKQYDAAIAKYAAFLEQFAASPQAPRARVRRAAARVLAARTASPNNWEPVLATAQEALPPIGSEEDVSQVHADLAPLLMDMAADLSARAGEGAADEQRIKSAREALALAGDGRFVPGSLRQWQRLALAEESVARIVYESERTKSLQTAAAAIKKGAETGDVNLAYAERGKLLGAYADLAGDPQLRDLGPPLASAATAKVQTADNATRAETAEAATSVAGSITFATPLVRTTASAAGPPAIVAAGGDLWAFDSATGRLLWRRFVDHGQSALPLAADGDVLLVDATGGELVRVAAGSGQLRWRHKLASPCAGLPIVVGDQVIAATRAGQVVAVDALSGSGKRTAQLPQTARVGPVADSSGKSVLQIGDHSLVYVLAAGDLASERALFVGHEAATVDVPPVVLPKHLVIAENRGAASCVLHVLTLDAGGLPQSIVGQMEVTGHVLAPLNVIEGRLIVLTDLGRVIVYESAADPTSGLKEVAQVEAGTAAGVARFGAVDAGKLLVAGQGLRSYSMPASGKPAEEWSAFAGDALLGPPQIAGGTVVTVRKQAGRSGLIATGVNLADGKTRWETRLAEPLAAVVSQTAAGQFAVVSASGAVAKLSADNLSEAMVHEFALPANAQAVGLAIRGAVPLAGGRLAFVPVDPARELLVLAPDADVLQRLPLPGELAGLPLAWRDGIAVGTAFGSIHFLDPITGSPQAEPFPLRLRPGQRLGNCWLADAGDQGGGGELLVADDRDALYCLGLSGDDPPRLVESGATPLQSPAIGGLLVGDKVAGLVDRRGTLLTFAMPEVKQVQSLDLALSAIVTGPTRADPLTLVTTDREELICLDRSLAQSWRAPLTHGRLAGEPAAAQGGLLVATRSGWLCLLDSKNGQETAAVDLGQPLAGTPLVAGAYALVPAADGAVLKVSLPLPQAAQP